MFCQIVIGPPILKFGVGPLKMLTVTLKEGILLCFKPIWFVRVRQGGNVFFDFFKAKNEAKLKLSTKIIILKVHVIFV